MWHPWLNIVKKRFWLFGDELNEIEDKELGLLVIALINYIST